MPKEPTVTHSLGPDDPTAQDQCATCSHLRWRHKEVDGQQVCTEYVDCVCGGHFVEMSMATRMARFVEAAQKLPPAMAAVRAAMTEAFRAFHGMHTAMQQAGLLPEDEPGLCDGCDTVTQVTATDDGRAQLCASCMRVLNNPNIAFEANRPPERTPALQQLATWHRVDCDKNCGGACTQGGDATKFVPPIPRHPSQRVHANSCATCWPRPCDPTRSMCRRNPNARSDEEATLDGATD